MSNSEDTGMAAIAHALGIIIGFIGPLIIYLMKPEEGFVREQAREALNFQITVAIAAFVSSLLMSVVIGFILLPLVLLANLVLCIMAALSASKGEAYRYPVAIRLIKEPGVGV